jgi:ABC-type nitrate/sulfonate/bicarbonate transport system substrate-binding protein
VAQFDKLRIAVPSLPDSIPIKLAIFRPIFKENRLDVNITLFDGEKEGKKLLEEGSVEGLICDLPTALLLAKGSPSTRIVKNVLRANPYRSLFALVSAPNVKIQDFVDMKDKSIAVPKGLSFRFYTEYYLKSLDVPLDKVTLREVEDAAKAWDLLNKGEVSAAVLRTPYSDIAMQKGMSFVADDRNLPWMSVLVLKKTIIEEKFEVLKRFIFGLEQSVLALNLKPDEFRALLQEEGGIPKEARKKFPMPIFEGANAPATDEIETIMVWLDEKGLLSRETPYEEMINPNFLPNPKDVGLAFCCR